MMIKLAATAEQAAALKQTLLTCNHAADFVSDTAQVSDAYTTRTANFKAGHYSRLGTKQYAGVADYTVPFRSLAVQPFDDRCLSWQLDSSTVSISTTSGRIKGVRFVCAPWQRKLLEDHKGESDLVFRDGQFDLYATVDQPSPTPGTGEGSGRRLTGCGSGDREPRGRH